jgi:hypothetical protein
MESQGTSNTNIVASFLNILMVTHAPQEDYYSGVTTSESCRWLLEILL